jgi:hypothetical protein
VDYLKGGSGSLMQCVITPADNYMSWTNEAIAAETDKQVRPQAGARWAGAPAAAAAAPCLACTGGLCCRAAARLRRCHPLAAQSGSGGGVGA